MDCPLRPINIDSAIDWISKQVRPANTDGECRYQVIITYHMYGPNPAQRSTYAEGGRDMWTYADAWDIKARLEASEVELPHGAYGYDVRIQAAR